MTDAALEWAGMSDEETEDPTFGLTQPVTVNKLAWAFFRMAAAQVTHTKLCNQQWTANNARLARIERILLGAVGAMVTGLAAALFHYLQTR